METQERHEITIDLPEPQVTIVEVTVACGETSVIVRERPTDRVWDVSVAPGHIARDDKDREGRSLPSYQAATEWARDYAVAKERRRRLWMAAQEIADASVNG